MRAHGLDARADAAPLDPARTRSGVPAPWRLLLRALADGIDGAIGAGERDGVLRDVGARLAGLSPLPAVPTLDVLEIEMNDALDAMALGRTGLILDEGARVLLIQHTGLPRIGSAGAPPGAWLAALLEGLYETWFAQQPGAEPGLTARRVPGGTAAQVTLRYGRGAAVEANMRPAPP